MNTHCPLCNDKSNNTEQLLDFSAGGHDQSYLYPDVNICCCQTCGHVFNMISRQDYNNLKKYYNDEASLSNINYSSTVADLPGSKNKNTIKRYQYLYKQIKPYLKKDFHILDIGCAKGGFIDFLFDKGYHNLYGIDITNNYLSELKKDARYKNRIKLAFVDKMPFDDKSFDFIILDHVLEHCFDIQKAMKEIKRVLKDDGYIYVGIPDAAQYAKYNFFEFYWFLIREHLHHFDTCHLNMLFSNYGFTNIHTDYTTFDMMSDKMTLPNIAGIFQNKGGSKPPLSPKSDLKKNIMKYIRNSQKELLKHSQLIANIPDEVLVNVWGMGKEFFFLYENTSLKHKPIIHFIDNNAHKQKHYTIKHQPIIASEKILDHNVMIIFARAHTAQIQQALLQKNYKGEIITL